MVIFKDYDKIFKGTSISCCFKCSGCFKAKYICSFPQGSLSEYFLVVIYINDFLDGKKLKILADDKSIFSNINDNDNSNTQLNSDLDKIRYGRCCYLIYTQISKL